MTCKTRMSPCFLLTVQTSSIMYVCYSNKIKDKCIVTTLLHALVDLVLEGLGLLPSVHVVLHNSHLGLFSVPQSSHGPFKAESFLLYNQLLLSTVTFPGFVFLTPTLYQHPVLRDTFPNLPFPSSCLQDHVILTYNLLLYTYPFKTFITDIVNFDINYL